jgi:hypothetical protein
LLHSFKPEFSAVIDNFQHKYSLQTLVILIYYNSNRMYDHSVFILKLGVTTSKCPFPFLFDSASSSPLLSLPVLKEFTGVVADSRTPLITVGKPLSHPFNHLTATLPLKRGLDHLPLSGGCAMGHGRSGAEGELPPVVATGPDARPLATLPWVIGCQHSSATRTWAD